MTTDDKLLLADLERIICAISEHFDYIDDGLRLRREMDSFRERLERRLSA